MSTTQTENLLRESYTKLSPQERQKLWESGQHKSKDAFTFYFMYNNYFDHRIFLDEHLGRALPYALGCLKGWQWLITEQGKPNIRQAFQYHQKNRAPGKKELFSHHHDDDRKKLLPISYTKDQAYNYLDPCVWGWVFIISPETEALLDLKYRPSHFKRTETVICRNHPENTMYTREVMFYFDLRNTTECIGRSLVDDQQEGYRWRTGMLQMQLAGAPQWWYYLVTQCLMGKGGRAENIVIENEWEGEKEDTRSGMTQLPLRNTSPIPLDEEVGDHQQLEQDVDVEMNERPALNIIKKKATTGMEPPPQRKHSHVMFVKKNPKNRTGNVVGSVHRVHRVAARADQRAPAGQIYKGSMHPPSSSASAPPTGIQGSSIQRPASISRAVSPPACQKLYRTGDLPGQNYQTQQVAPSELQRAVNQNQSQQYRPEGAQVPSPHTQLQQQVSARAAQPPFPPALGQSLSQQQAPGIMRPSQVPTSQVEQQRGPTSIQQRQSSIVQNQQQQFLNDVAATAQFLEGRIRHAGEQLSAEQKLKLHQIQQKNAEIKSMAAQPQKVQAIPKPTKEPQPPVGAAAKMTPIDQKPVSSLQGAQFNPPSHQFSTQRHASLQPPQVPSWAAGIARPMSAIQTHTEESNPPQPVENLQLGQSVEESEMHNAFTSDPASHSLQQNSGVQTRSSSTEMAPGPDNGENQEHTSVSIVPNHKYKCKVQGCGQTFASSQGLHRHRKGHTPEEMATCDPPVSRSGTRTLLKRKFSNSISSAVSRQRASDSLSQNASSEHDLPQTKSLPSQSKHVDEPRGITASSLIQSTSTNSQRPHVPSSLSQGISAEPPHPEVSSPDPLVSPQLPRHKSHFSHGLQGTQPLAKLGSSPAKPVFVGGPQNSSSPMMAPRLPGMGDFSPQKRSGSMKTDTPTFPYPKRRSSVTSLDFSPPKMAIPQGSSQIQGRPSSLPSSMQSSTMMAQNSSLAQPQPNSSSIAPPSMMRMEQRQSPRPVRGLSSSGRYFETMPGPSWMVKHRQAAMGPPPGGVTRPMPPNPSSNPYLQNPLLPPQQQNRSSPAIASSPDRTISENPSPVPPPSTPPPQRHPSNSKFRSSPPQMLVRGPSQEPPSPTDAVARRHAMHRGAQNEKERL